MASITIRNVDEKLKQPEVAAGYVLDGFPRTVAQAEALDRLLQDRGITHVINLDVPRDEIVRRLSGRRSCPKCQRVYHMDSAPPAREGRCDNCGESLQQRVDDKPETIESRLAVYDRQTRPLIEYYDKKGLLHNLDATGSIERVYANVLAAVHSQRHV